MSLFNKIINRNDSIMMFKSPKHLVNLESVDDKVRIKNQKISNKSMLKLRDFEMFLCSLPQLKETLQTISNEHENELNKALMFFEDDDFALRVMCVQEATILLGAYLEQSHLGKYVIKDWFGFLYEYMVHSAKQFCLYKYGCVVVWENDTFLMPDIQECKDTIEVVCKILYELGGVYHAIGKLDKPKMIEHCKKLRVSNFI